MKWRTEGECERSPQELYVYMLFDREDTWKDLYLLARCRNMRIPFGEAGDEVTVTDESFVP